ncbi:MAG: DUF3450 domain-containing protein [Pseudomonadales bacterium]|nr:DUF3450 domain-containing protein [Pseudomonadales bacterium]
MNSHPLKTVLASVLTAVVISLGGISSSYADQLDEIHKINKDRTTKAQQSQARVDKLNDQRLALLDEYKAVNKIIDGLRVYNSQLEKQIAAQQNRLQELEDSIQQATVIKRQITPLMHRMVDGLEQFVSLDVPFHKSERDERIQFIKDALDNPDIPDSEKFRQVLEGYQIENEYGRKIDSYSDTVNIDGNDVIVNVLRVGRIALVAQSKDGKTSLAWDNNERKWVELDASYRNPVREGIRIANKQATIDILMLPIAAPENAQ